MLRTALGGEFEIIEEGLNGRTTCRDDPVEGAHKNGSRFLQVVIETHAPFDLLIIKLGTNDLKARLAMQAGDIARTLQTAWTNAALKEPAPWFDRASDGLFRPDCNFRVQPNGTSEARRSCEREAPGYRGYNPVRNKGRPAPREWDGLSHA